MTYKDAIAKADSFRPNTLDEKEKYEWLHELDADIAETMELSEIPENPFPGNAELLMPDPHDNIYVLYLAARIDYFNEELDLYGNDMQFANQAVNEAKAWWRRHHHPHLTGGFIL